MKAQKVRQKNPKQVAVKKKKDLSKVTTKEFFEQDFENDTDSSDDVNEQKNNKSSKQEDNDSDNSESILDPTEHKISLLKLKDTDPEFYKYLKENDKNLLEFKVSDDEEDDDDIPDETDDKYIPDENLQVASDDSDFEPDTGISEDGSKNKITLQLLKTWQQKIQTDKSLTTIKCAVDAFHAALETVAESGDTTTLRYKVEGSAVFNGVVQLCIMYLPDAFKCFLKVDSMSLKEVHKSKRFPKVRGILKSYLADLIKILQSVTSANIITVILKHLYQMLPYTQSFSSLTKPLLKILLKLWSTGEENVRVVAFINIFRVATNHTESVLEMLLKTMYVNYVKNAKFVSPNTLPEINFMRHSLAEIYLLDHNLSYRHAFLYIRQLAIHLRNATTLKKKENFQVVYNWQYINSLRFWTELVAKSKKQSMLRSLLYPLVQIITGTIKLIPTAQYYPLRFHCVQMLIIISKETRTFIPILPFVLEILDAYDFNKKHKTVSMKPVPLTCILRMSKSQLAENGFKDSVIETVYQLILENAANDSHMIYFPDVYIPCIIQLKAFLKKCRVASYCRKIKQLLDKIEENRRYIETERIKIPIDLKNMEEITNWENRIKTDGTSIAKFYASWIKLHESQKLKLLTKTEEISEYKLPVMKKSKKRELDEQVDEESENESELELQVKEINGNTREKSATSKSKSKTVNKSKKKMKISTKNIEDEDLPRENTDIVQDINGDDWN